jgi:hypothetical protein
MTCGNNFDIHEFEPKDNNDMMQWVTHYKFFKFVPGLKTLEKQGKHKYLCGVRKFYQCSWSERQ